AQDPFFPPSYLSPPPVINRPLGTSSVGTPERGDVAPICKNETICHHPSPLVGHRGPNGAWKVSTEGKGCRRASWAGSSEQVASWRFGVGAPGWCNGAPGATAACVYEERGAARQVELMRLGQPRRTSHRPGIGAQVGARRQRRRWAPPLFALGNFFPP